METSEIKTVKSTSEEYFEVSMVKISGRSDKVKERLLEAQSWDLVEKTVFEKNEKQVWDQRKLFFHNFMDNFSWGFHWTHFKSFLKTFFFGDSFSWAPHSNWTTRPNEVKQTPIERPTYGLSTAHINKQKISKVWRGGGTLK